MNPASRSLCLLAPGVLGPSLPGHPGVLARLLARADVRPDIASSLDAMLFELFGVAHDAARDLPVAPITHYLDTGIKAPGWWLRADPVYCEPDRDAVRLLGYLDVDLAQAETDALVAEINAFWAPTGWQLAAPAPQRWYLHLPEDPLLRTTPLTRMLGEDIHFHLPQGPRASFWHTRLNEIQMLLHASPVNAARRAQGKFPVNSLWFWGGGTLPQIANNAWAQVWSNEALGQGLARLAAVPRRAAPGSGAQWLGEAITPGRHLVVLGGDSDTSLSILEGGGGDSSLFEASWMVPLEQSLRAGDLAEIRLWLGGSAMYHLTRKNLRRWWRRARPLEEYQ